MPQLSPASYRRFLFLIWFASALLLLFAGREAIAGWQMGDPDDQLRLVQIRDWLAGQSWWDVTQYRMNPPDGGPMHWSRLVDVPVAACILLLTPFLGTDAAQLVAVVLVPLLTYGIVLWLMAAIATRIDGRMAGIVAAVSLFAILPATIQLVPMRIDHHGWQLVAFLAATWALLDTERPKLAAIVIGIACALWMEISIEGLPFAALFIGLLGLRWLWGDGRNEVQFPIAAAVLAAATGFFYLITEGFNPTNHCDSLSPVHVAALTAAALIACVAHPLTAKLESKARLAARLVAGGFAAAAALAALLWIAPQCAGDAFAGLDPLVRAYWYNRTPEGLPLWQHKPTAIMAELAGLLAGMIGLIALWRQPADAPQTDRLALTLLFAGSALVAMQVARATVYPLCLTAIIMAPLIVRLFARSNSAPTLGGRMALRIAPVMLLMPGLLGTHASRAFQPGDGMMSPQQVAREAAFIERAKLCHSAETIRLLNQLPPKQLMLGLDASPGVLQFTHHKVIATGHHRNQAAMRDVIRAYTMPPEVMRTVLRERQVDYLVACDGSFELRVYAENAPNGFWAQMKAGEQFPWLVRQPDIGPFHVWQVDKAKLAP